MPSHLHCPVILRHLAYVDAGYSFTYYSGYVHIHKLHLIFCVHYVSYLTFHLWQLDKLLSEKNVHVCHTTLNSISGFSKI